MRDEDLVLDYHEECRKNAIYVHGTLQVHCVRRIVDRNQCKLDFYTTSVGEYLMKSVAYSYPHTVPVTGNYYIFSYEGSHFPGQATVVNECKKTVIVKCMQKAAAPPGPTWKWPKRVDEHEYIFEDAVKEIAPPQLLPGGCRGVVFKVPELAEEWSV